MKIPKSLRVWFVIHFILDFLFALPLLIAPEWFLTLFGFTIVDPVTARLVGAALIGIGGISLLTHKEGRNVFRALLKLKLLWSAAAVLGLVLSLIQGAPLVIWFILLVFVLFFFLWLYYLRQLR